MADTPELKKIKKIYGEKFKNLCRDMFPIILEQEGTLLNILEKRFSHNCNSLYESLTENGLESEFKELIYSEFDLKREKEEQVEERTPYEILDEAGYNLYECKTEDDIQSFRKYYARDELLCTIYNGGRLNTRDCFFAVRKDVDKIERENFTNPQKGDEYSTSVLGIQFTRDARCTVDIISRYNHTVSNPNCTLGNNLDRLAPSLSQSFTNLLKERGLNFNNSQIETDFEIPGYTLASDGKYYKYNMEVDGIYYCPNNIIIGNGVPREAIPLDRGMVIDNFCIDFKNKEIKLLDNQIADSFVDGLQDIEKMEVEKSENDGKVIKVYLNNKEEPVVIGVDKDNQIIKYENQYLQQVGNDFLRNNTALKELNLPKLRQAEGYFFNSNTALTALNLPELQRAGDDFLYCNTALTKLNLPKLQEVGDDFLSRNRALTGLNLPKLQKVGDNFLFDNTALAELNLPELQRVKDGFLWNNTALTALNLPELQQVGNRFLLDNTTLMELNLPKLQLAGHKFLFDNTSLTKVDLSKLQRVGDCFLFRNIALAKLNLPELQQVGDDFLFFNTALTKLNLPELQYAGNYFLNSNTALTKLNLPKNPELEKLLREKNNLKNITTLDIAALDKESGLTPLEIKSARDVIQNNIRPKLTKKEDVNK